MFNRIKIFFKKIYHNYFLKNKGYSKFICLKIKKNDLFFEALSPVESYRIANYGDEREFLDFFLSNLKPDDVIFDIGASVGLFTIHASSIVNRGKVFAFEPDPDTLGRLKHNASLNRQLLNINYISWAVSDTQSETLLYSDGSSGSAPTLRQQLNRENAPKGEVKVKTNTLDNAISTGELPVPTVLKIDIEGAEILCIKGALKLLQGNLGKKPRLIFLEAHPDFLPSFNSTVEEVYNLILNNGYSVFWKKERDSQIHYVYQSS